MSLIQRSLKAAPLLSKCVQLQPVRNLQAIPCRNPIRGPKLAIMASSMVVMWLTGPFYVLYNMKYYNGSVTRD